MLNLGKRFLKVGTVLLAAVLLLELSYRFYIIEFYAPELNALNNSVLSSEKNEPTILFLGDSFTASANSYVAKLRHELPLNLVNSAVSGTGILETSFMFSSRIKRFKPSVVVYQIYLGNDLLDIRHRPTGKISSIRRIYHAVSDRIRVLKLLNYRLAQVRFNVYNDLELPLKTENTAFSEANYHPRQKMIFKEEPLHLENVLELKNGRDGDFEVLKSRLRKIEEQLNDTCQLLILLVPHCAQVNETYHSRMKLLGSDSKPLSSNEFYSRFESEFSEHTIIDALPLFQQMDKPTHRIYLENNPHLSDYGQTVLANLMKPYLQAEPAE